MKNKNEIIVLTIPTYFITESIGGKWLHAPGSNFLFAFLKNTWSSELTHRVTKAFEEALLMSSKVKDAVEITSGHKVVSGLYLESQDVMTKTMNSIKGMGLTSVSSRRQQGSGTAQSINQKFFSAVLEGLGGEASKQSNSDWLSAK